MKKYACPLQRTMDLIGTKWKPQVLFHLLEGPQRSGVLQQTMPGISNKMFTQTVRELEQDHLLTRTVYPVVPPHVEYELTALGQSIKLILCELDEWGKLEE
ncbi:winged helix-turn-helix transcriptional regulator [Hymenobacter negativus]|uniref:Helix-turn-helix transcriptional regulator n=1 Tax=Hymenobacter negativus TaxID=2795026 RepID=A0ABS3QPS5_9BACT|nr:helix-turn-helix domain-containing protein [Hymenobacter negativus]MBO2012685.1 helix-turn-helix transcriptional regulator [Hymenobacter negativus]